MLSLSVNNTLPKVYETYLVRLSDGNAYEIPADYRPLKFVQGGWTANYDVNAVKKGNDMVFYSLGENKLNKITINDKDHFDFETIDVSGIAFNNYDADYEGHVMIGNSYIVSSDTIYTTSIYEQENSIIVKAYDYGFNIIKLKDNTFQTFHIYVQDNVLKEDTLTALSLDYTGWNFIGSFSFPDYYQTLVVFDKGIVDITKVETKLVTSISLKINTIALADQSRINYYLAGTNDLNAKVFLKVNPAFDPPTFTDLIVPNAYNIRKLHVSGDNTVSIMAVKVSDQKEIFRYIRQTGSTLDVINYQAIKTRQVFTVK